MNLAGVVLTTPETSLEVLRTLREARIAKQSGVRAWSVWPLQTARGLPRAVQTQMAAGPSAGMPSCYPCQQGRVVPPMGTITPAGAVREDPAPSAKNLPVQDGTERLAPPWGVAEEEVYDHDHHKCTSLHRRAAGWGSDPAQGSAQPRLPRLCPAPLFTGR